MKHRLPSIRFHPCFICGFLSALLHSGSSALIAQDPSPLAVAAAMERLVTDAIQRAEKSVVAISRVRKDDAASEHQSGDLAVSPDPLLERISPTEARFVPTEFGTGVIIDASGLVLTNYHVLGNVQQSDFFVWQSRKPYSATVKAADPWLDLAVLKFEGSGFVPISFGNARDLKKGQFVIALGNPYAIARDGQPSASWGIISNLQRQAPPTVRAARGGDGRETLHHYGTLIQTDARLELGNSGGALVNLQGEMIGLTTSLAALYGYERAGGFAIPVDDAFRRALEMLKAGRVPDYGLLGIEPAVLATEMRQHGRTGARVRSVADASPAKQAGLRDGDIVTRINDWPIHDDLDLIRRVSSLFAGDAITLSVLRGASDRRAGQSLTMKAVLSKKRLTTPRPAFSDVQPLIWRGLRVDYATASPRFAERSRELDPAGCVAVLEVMRESPAWDAGFRSGDFLTHVGANRVATPDDFLAAVRDLEGDVTLRLTGVGRSAATRTVRAE